MRIVGLMVSVLLLLAPACAQRREAPQQGNPPPQDTTTTAASTTALTTTLSTAPPTVDTVIPLSETRFLERAAVGQKLGADGMVDTELTTLKRSQPIYASVRAKEVPAGLVARVVWFGPGDKKIAEEQLPVPPDTRFVTFQAKNARTWKAGTYGVQVWLGGDNVYEQEFRLQ